jgi:hypothetical protein
MEDLLATSVLDEAANSAFDDIFDAVCLECFLLTMLMVWYSENLNEHGHMWLLN